MGATPGYSPDRTPAPSAAAVIYTVLGTCRLRGVELWAWLRDVLEKLASGWKRARIEELPPREPAATEAA